MALHRLTQIVMGVPNVEQTAAYYAEFDDALWKPGVWEGPRGLYSWGPPPPASFLAPEDLAALMTGAHSPR